MLDSSKITALILAAGKGERLRPLTELVPKPMVEIGGQPILRYNLELLRNAGIQRAIINLHHLPHKITEYFGNGTAFGIELEYSLEPELLGTAGAARAVADRLKAETVVVIYGDNLSTLDLNEFLSFHASADADFTLAIFNRDDVSASGVVEVDTGGRVRRFIEKPRAGEAFSNWVNAGCYALRPWVLETIPEGRASDFSVDVIPALLGRGARVFGYRMTEKIWWIDSLADYERTAASFASPEVRDPWMDRR